MFISDDVCYCTDHIQCWNCTSKNPWYKEVKCECGSEKVNKASKGPNHSFWCPAYEKENNDKKV